MGLLGGIESRSDSRTDQSNQAGGANAINIVERGGGRVTLPGGISGNVIDKSNEGLQNIYRLGRNANLTINTGLDQDAFNAALDRLNQDEGEGDNAALQDLFNTSLTKLTELSEQRLQEGQAPILTNRTIFYLAVVVAAAVALIFIFRRK
jgi:hypothetical protein